MGPSYRIDLYSSRWLSGNNPHAEIKKSRTSTEHTARLYYVYVALVAWYPVLHRSIQNNESPN